MDLAIPGLTGTSTQASPQVAMPGDITSVAHVSHSPSLPAMPKTLEVASISPIPQSQAPTIVRPTDLPDAVLWVQGLMNMALESLLTTRASIDSHHRELALNAKLTVWMNEAKAHSHGQGGRGVQCNHDQGGRGVLHSHNQGGGGAPCDQCLCPATNAQGEHTCTGVQGDSRGRVGLLSLHGGLWSGLMGLSTQGPWGSDVPPAISNWQCVSSHHFGNAGYYPTASYYGQRTNISSFHPKGVRYQHPSLA